MDCGERTTECRCCDCGSLNTRPTLIIGNIFECWHCDDCGLNFQGERWPDNTFRPAKYIR